jgi:hypothetical protein
MLNKHFSKVQSEQLIIMLENYVPWVHFTEPASFLRQVFGLHK